MNILAVDDERMALELLARSIMEYDPNSSLHMFRNPLNALEFAKNQECSVAFLDLHMGQMDGIKLAEELKKLYPAINIIFTTGFSEYALDAFSIHASGYVMKPVTPDKIKKEMENLRNASNLNDNRIQIQCFGNFEIFINGSVVNFKYAKTKELLAYLVERRGASCTNDEITAVLWEDGKHDSYLRNIRKDLIDTLAEYGCDNVIQTGRAKINIFPGKIDCDYYQWLENKETANYRGEYMNQYSWGEITNAWLSHLAS